MTRSRSLLPLRLLAGAVALLVLAGGLVAADRLAAPAARALAAIGPRPAAVATDLAPLPVAAGDRGTAVPTAPLPTSTAAAAAPAPVPLAPVEPVRAAVVADLPPDGGAPGEAAVRALVAGLDGVQRVAGITVVQTSLGGVAAELAAVDVEEFRAFTPPATANHPPLWERLDAGDVAVTHEFGTVHEVPLGSTLATGVALATGEPATFRVGAFATNGTPPVADAIVRAGALPGAAGVRRLLLALDPLASPEATVEALADAGVTAEVVPDPRAPRSQTVVPVGEITPENVWDHLAMCESSGNWQINTGNGYYGGLQFLPESWAWVGGQGLPHEHTREEQIYRATLLWQIQGWEAWPQCARKLGLIVDPPPEPTPDPSPQPVVTEPS